MEHEARPQCSEIWITTLVQDVVDAEVTAVAVAGVQATSIQVVASHHVHSTQLENAKMGEDDYHFT
jgi:hypothetical protein